MEQAINLFAMIVESAVPFAIAFSVGQLIVNSFLKMAFGGKVQF